MLGMCAEWGRSGEEVMEVMETAATFAISALSSERVQRELDGGVSVWLKYRDSSSDGEQGEVDEGELMTSQYSGF